LFGSKSIKRQKYMSIRENILDNKDFLFTAVADLVESEKSRILESGLASEEQMKVVSNAINYFTKKNTSAGNIISIKAMSNLCEGLKKVTLPGDFDKIAADEEEFYILLDIPYDGDQFYDLSSILKDKKDEKEDEDDSKEDDSEGSEEDKESEEKDASDDDKNADEEDEECVMCDLEEAEADEDVLVLMSSVGSYLNKLANICGSNGRHDAAYLIEKELRSMSKKILKGS
jgi:hypothetical protein